MRIRIEIRSTQSESQSRVSRRLLLRLGEAFIDLVPVDHVPPGGKIFRAAVLVLQIVGMLPHVVAQDREESLGKRAVLVSGGDDLQLAVPDQPAPAGAELLRGGFVELLFE